MNEIVEVIPYDHDHDRPYLWKRTVTTVTYPEEDFINNCLR